MDGEGGGVEGERETEKNYKYSGINDDCISIG